MDQRLAGVKNDMDHQMRVSSLYSFSVKVASYLGWELRFSGDFCWFSGQIQQFFESTAPGQRAAESNRRCHRGIEPQAQGQLGNLDFAV